MFSTSASKQNTCLFKLDLRYVYRDLANEDDLVEIDDNFSEHLIDRLEFGDNIIRTLFDNFVTKYIIQPAATGSK